MKIFTRSPFLDITVTFWCLPCKKNSRLVGRGEESALNQREVTEVLGQKFNPGFVSTWSPTSLECEGEIHINNNNNNILNSFTVVDE